ncbi:sulfatase [Luteitalea sp. TBR-22]|uniref:sulfatase family protein n=1 Tax=Luteitalea sp. TBR-22 TaxID=2802971 RepID=UPI001AF9E767|nr:sulfatase-like hydrolase/transferase [Luteitalea sp. TBR-22]BCS33237.1 sulfatase [Luteitalea sp. TBR-22]
MTVGLSRFALTCAAAALVVVTAPGTPHAAATQSAPPWNVLLITNDEQRHDALGAAGNPVIRTPNMDRLAREGVLFERNFVQSPQCVPSRSAMHTGRYPHVTRTMTNQHELPEDEETLADILDARGYATAAIGDEPFAPTNAMGGFRQFYATDPDWLALLDAKGWGPRAAEHRARARRGFQNLPAPWPEELDETTYFAGKAIEYITGRRDRPFFLHVNFRRPHFPFDPPAPYDRMYAGASFPASHSRPGEMDGKPPSHAQALADTGGADLRTMTAADLEQIKSYYYGMVSLNDTHIGRILDTLEALGLASRTIVIVTADHGEMLGDHGLLFKAGYMYDEVVRTPLLMRAPGKLPAGRRVTTLTEAIDIMPTVLELLEMAPSPRIQGRSLLPQVAGTSASRDAVYAEFPATKMIRTDDWKLVHYVGQPLGELYDLRQDPNELHNLFADEAHREIKAQLLARLLDWMVRTADPALPPRPGTRAD